MIIKTWAPVTKEKLAVFLETDNEVDKYTFCVNRKYAIVDHVPSGKHLKFAKNNFLFSKCRKTEQKP